MHVLKFSAPCERLDGQTLAPGEYLVEDVNMPELIAAAERDTMSVSGRWAHVTPPNLADCMTLLIIGPGGYGDVMMLTPVLAALRAKHPNLHIGLSVRERSRCVLDHLNLVDEFEDYPLPRERVISYDAIVLLENCNESGDAAKTKHAITNKADRVGIQVSDMTVRYVVTDDEKAWAAENYPRRLGRPRVGVQLRASAANRTFPMNMIFGAVGPLIKNHQWEVFTFATPGTTDQWDVAGPFVGSVWDLAKDKLTFRQSAAVAQTCDVILAPDSALMHVAGALDIPCLALFGPIDWKLRTTQYKSVRALRGTTGCDIAPCFYHPASGRQWPKGQPCEKSGRCEVMCSIDPEQIAKELLRLKP